MSSIKTHKRSIVLAVIASFAIAAAAVAYWTGAGGGGGTAVVGTSGSVTINVTVPDDIAPGTSMPVTFAAANATDSPIQVTTVTLDSVSADSAHADCDTRDFSMESVTEDHQIPAGATAEALPNDGSLVYANTDVDQNACKGATLTLAVSSAE